MFDLWLWPDVALVPGIIGLFLLSEAVAAVGMSTQRAKDTEDFVWGGGGLPLPIVGFILLCPGIFVLIVPFLQWARKLLGKANRTGHSRCEPLLPHSSTRGALGSEAPFATILGYCRREKSPILLGGFVAGITILYLLALQHLTPNGLIPLLMLTSLWHRTRGDDSSSPVAVSMSRFVAAALCVLFTMCFGLVALSDRPADLFDRMAGVVMGLLGIIGTHVLQWLVARHNANVLGDDDSAERKGRRGQSLVTFQSLSGYGAGWMLMAAVIVVVFRGFVLEVEREVVGDAFADIANRRESQSQSLFGTDPDARKEDIMIAEALIKEAVDTGDNDTLTSRRRLTEPAIQTARKKRNHRHHLHKFDASPLNLSLHAILFTVLAVVLLGPASAFLVNFSVKILGAGGGGNGRPTTLILVLSPSGRCLLAFLLCAVCTWSNILCLLPLSDFRVVTALASLLVVTLFSSIPTDGARDDEYLLSEDGLLGRRKGERKGPLSILLHAVSSPFAIRSLLFLSEKDQKALPHLLACSSCGGDVPNGRAMAAKRGGIIHPSSLDTGNCAMEVSGGVAKHKHYGVLSAILSDPKQRRLCIFLCLTLSFMFVELLAGLRYNSLGLISDAFHMLLDSSSIAIGLWSAHIATWPRNRTYPLGYGLFQLLSGFTNGVLLVFIALYVLCEAAERILDPPTVEAQNLFGVSLIGLLINVIGVVFFHDAHHGGGSHGHSHGAGGSCPMSSSSDDHNMRGVYLHILADLFGSIAVMFSSIVIQYTGWNWVDPFCSGLLSIVILISAGPLLSSTCSLLLQKSPTRVVEGRDAFFALLAGGATDTLLSDHSGSGCCATNAPQCAPPSLFAQGEVKEVTRLSAWSHATTPSEMNVVSISVVMSRTKMAGVYSEQAVRARILEAAYLTIATPSDTVGIEITVQ